MRHTVSLKKNSQFRFVYNKGKSVANRLLVMIVLRTESGQNRLGISVSKKVGKAVVRNRVRRLIRESYRLSEGCVSAGFDIVVIARAGAKSAAFADIDGAVRHLLKKQTLWLPNAAGPLL